MKKFLVIQTAFIGDVVLATGILEKLHHFYPDAEIDLLVRKGNEGYLLIILSFTSCLSGTRKKISTKIFLKF